MIVQCETLDLVRVVVKRHLRETASLLHPSDLTGFLSSFMKFTCIKRFFSLAILVSVRLYKTAAHNGLLYFAKRNDMVKNLLNRQFSLDWSLLCTLWLNGGGGGGCVDAIFVVNQRKLYLPEFLIGSSRKKINRINSTIVTTPLYRSIQHLTLWPHPHCCWQLHYSRHEDLLSFVDCDDNVFSQYALNVNVGSVEPRMPRE